MKHGKLFVFSLMILIFIISCGNKDAKNIISIKNASAEKLINSFTKFENNFMLRSDIADNGYEQLNFFLTDYDIQGPKVEKFLQSAAPFIDSVIENKIGVTSRFINDKKAQAFKFSYAFNNILQNEEKTDVINIVMGQKNIEAASPSIFNKAFSIPAQDLGKALALIAPKEVPANLNIDLTYNTLRTFTSIQPDKASQKRYDKAQGILYKHAVITRNGDTYSIVFNNDDIVKFIPALVNAVKNDNRIKALWNFYEKLFEKEFKEIEEKFNTEIKDKIKECSFTEELIVKDNLVIKDICTVSTKGKEIVHLETGIKNYENPIDGMTYTLNITDPKLIDKDTKADIISFVFATEGTITDTTAKIDYSASMSVTNDTEKSSLSDIDMHYYFYADTTKQNDNFKIGMDVTAYNGLDGKDKGTKQVLMNIAMQALGTVEKAPDIIIYKVDTIGMDLKTPDTEQYTVQLETDASVIYSKNILEDIVIPNDTVKVLEIKVNEWQAIKDEITANLNALSTLLNL